MAKDDRINALKRLLADAGLKPASPPPRPALIDLDAADRKYVLDLYQRLGGVQAEPKLRPGSWDASFAGLVVELDEEFHFNRYRAVTLTTSNLPWTSVYLDYSRLHEGRCLQRARVGGRWSNPSCERQFGPAAPPGDLGAPGGAPRWKQRALYDAMKDHVPRLGFGVQVARVAVFDQINGCTVEDILRGTAPVEPAAVRAFVEQRAA